MFKIVSTKTLLLLITVLLAVLALNKFQSQKSENTFNEDFVKIDSGAVTQLIIYPKNEKGKEIKISRNGKNWELQYDKQKTSADRDAVRNLLASFVKVKALNLGAQDKSGWKSLQIDDSTGTHLKFITATKSYDFMLGKFSYNSSSRNGMSYIRNKNEEKVYAVEGYMSLLMNEGLVTWRKKTVISGNKNNWTSLTFSYPGDSSFILNKQNNQWLLNGGNADSSKVNQFLTTLETLNSAAFVENYTPSSTPLYSLTINGNNQAQTINVLAYASDSIQKFILHSNLNNDAYFSDGKSNLAHQVFVGKASLLK